MFFYFVELFFALPFCRFFSFLREIFLTSLGEFLFSHSAESEFEHQLLSKEIQDEQSQNKKIEVRNRNGINP